MRESKAHGLIVEVDVNVNTNVNININEHLQDKPMGDIFFDSRYSPEIPMQELPIKAQRC
jgi:hypothetical protein